MPQGGARGLNLEHLIFFSFLESFVFEQHVLFCDFRPPLFMTQGAARGQNLGHLLKLYSSFPTCADILPTIY